MNRTIIAVTLVLVFTVALAAPAFAQSLSMSTTYDMEGTINFEKQAGHKCNTGAEVKQTIVGNGTMNKVQNINMVEGRIMMEDDNNWVAGATPMTVTTVWDLCAPPKYTLSSDNPEAVALGDLYNEDGFNGDNYYALTGQIWAVQVQADPGFSGSLYQNGIAAYGGFDARNRDSALADDYDRWYNDGTADKWTWVNNKDGNPVATVGPDFVGNFFDIEQHARTSQGTLRRYIDISSPFNHGYLMEDMSVVGRSDVQETFSMKNLPAGSDIVGQWWDMF